jgi:hypothetical protein
MNRKLAEEKVTLELLNGEERTGFDVKVKSDSTSVGDINLSTASIKKITNTRHGKGALKGLGGGLVTGAAIGFGLGYFSYNESQSDWFHSAGEAGGIGAIIFGVPAALVGLIAGAIHGDIETFIFTPPEIESKPSNRVEFTEIVEEGSKYIIILWQGKEIRLSYLEYNYRGTTKEGKQFIVVPGDIFLQKFK